MKNSPLRLLPLVLGLATAAHAQVFLIDFGPNATTSTGWNNLTGASSTSVSISLVASDGSATTAQLITSVSPNHFTNAGTTSATTTAFGAFPSTAVGDFLASSNTSTVLTITGLDPSRSYSFEFFASRSGGPGTRTTDYTLTNGGRTASALTSLDAGDNISNTSIISSFTPSTEGQIVLTLTRGAGNTVGFTYLNAMTITTSPVPEPASFAGLAGLGALGFVATRRRRS